VTINRCPACKQRIYATPERPAVRVCYDCKKPIANHDKWTMQEREGILTPVHRICAHPSMYVLPSEYRRKWGNAAADRMNIPKED